MRDASNEFFDSLVTFNHRIYIKLNEIWNIRIFYLVFIFAHIYTHIRSFTRVHLHANNPQYSSFCSDILSIQNLE